MVLKKFFFISAQNSTKNFFHASSSLSLFCEKVRENLKLLVGRWKGVLWGFRTRRIRIWHFHTCKSCYSCTWDCLSHWLVHGSRLTVEVKLFGNVYVLLNPAFPMPTVQLSLTLRVSGPFRQCAHGLECSVESSKTFFAFLTH